MNDCGNSAKKEGGHLRKKHKIIMEKRRRSRINTCLSQLKSILLQSMKKENSEFSKLEKADILEMTVKYLRNVQRQQFSVAMTTDPSALNKYVAGFNECATEAMHYLDQSPTGSDDVKARLSDHLARCTQVTVLQQPSTPVAPVAVQSTQIPSLVLPQQVYVQVPVFPANVNPSSNINSSENNSIFTGVGNAHVNLQSNAAPALNVNCLRTPPVSPVSMSSESSSPVRKDVERRHNIGSPDVKPPTFSGIKTPAMKKEHSWSHAFHQDITCSHNPTTTVPSMLSYKKCFDNTNSLTGPNRHYDAINKMWRPW